MPKNEMTLGDLEKATDSYIAYLNYEIDKEIKDAVQNLQTLIRDQEKIISRLQKQNPKENYQNARGTLASLAAVIDKKDQEGKEDKEASRNALRAWLEEALDESESRIHKDKSKADVSQDLMKKAIFASFQKSGKRAVEQGVNTDYAKLPQLIREYNAAKKMQTILTNTSDAAQKKAEIGTHFDAHKKTFDNGSVRGRSFSYIAGHLLDKLFGRNKHNSFTNFQKPSEQFQKAVEMFRSVNPKK